MKIMGVDKINKTITIIYSENEDVIESENIWAGEIGPKKHFDSIEALNEWINSGAQE